MGFFIAESALVLDSEERVTLKWWWMEFFLTSTAYVLVLVVDFPLDFSVFVDWGL